MLKISEYELLQLLVLVNSNNILEDNVEQMEASKNPLSNQVGKIMGYMSLKDISGVKERMKLFKDINEKDN